jgi:hypothetical protein
MAKVAIYIKREAVDVLPVTMVCILRQLSIGPWMLAYVFSNKGLLLTSIGSSVVLGNIDGHDQTNDRLNPGNPTSIT